MKRSITFDKLLLAELEPDELDFLCASEFEPGVDWWCDDDPIMNTRTITTTDSAFATALTAWVRGELPALRALQKT